jgi:hypothetical protein
MKWLLILLPFLVGLVAAIATVGLVGLLLPVKHSATRSARLPRPAQDLWQVVTDFPNHPSWQPGVKGVERLPDVNGHAVWRETGPNGPIPFEVVESTAPRRFVTRIADLKLPFGGTWTIELEPLSGGGGGPTESSCRVRITEDGEVYNPVFRYVSRITGYTGTMESYLTALGKKFGQETQVEP